MNYWHSIPNQIPINRLLLCPSELLVRGSFRSNFDSTSQTWTDTEYNFEYPVWSVSRWRYSDPDYEDAFNLPFSFNWYRCRSRNV